MSNIDDTIRTAVHEIVAAAPRPRPLSLERTRFSYLTFSIAAVAMLVIGGAVAFTAWQPDSTKVIPANTVDNTLPPTDSVPPSTVGEQTTTPDSPNWEASSFEMPVGSIYFGVDDLLARSSEGDLVLLRDGVMGASSDPVVLVDMPELAGSADDLFADAIGVVDGVLIYSVCCSDGSRDLMGLTDLGSPPVRLASGGQFVLSPHGTQLAGIDASGLSVIDFGTDSRAFRTLDQAGDPTTMYDLQWSVDGKSLIMLNFDDSGWSLVRLAASPPFAVIEKVHVDTSFQRSPAQVSFAGTGSSGNLAVVIETSEETIVQWYDQELRGVSGEKQSLPLGSTHVHVSSLDDSMLWLVDDEMFVWSGRETTTHQNLAEAWFVRAFDTNAFNNLHVYLTALADGRYADAAVFLRGGGLEDERRADLRPLLMEFGSIGDLAERLELWCNEFALCVEPESVTVSGYWYVATFQHGPHPVVAYFRSGFFEGVADVHGLPPRVPLGSEVIACPSTGTEATREADLDGDGSYETVVMQRFGSSRTLVVCGTSAHVDSLAVGPDDSIAVLYPAAVDFDVIWVGTSTESGTCGSLYQLEGLQLVLTVVGLCTTSDFEAGTGESFGCAEQAPNRRVVKYEYTMIGGTWLDRATSFEVDVFDVDGEPIESLAYALPEKIDDAIRIIDPHCGELSIFTW